MFGYTYEPAMLGVMPAPFPHEVCELCNIPGHPPYLCSEQDSYPEYVKQYMNFYNQAPRSDPFTTSYPPSWQNNHHFSWSHTQNQFHDGSSFEPQDVSSTPSLEEALKMLAKSTHEFQQMFQHEAATRPNLKETMEILAQDQLQLQSVVQNQAAALTKLETQVEKLVDAMSQWEPRECPNPNEILEGCQEPNEAITMLGSGKFVDNGLNNETNPSYVVDVGADFEEKENQVEEEIGHPIFSSSPSNQSKEVDAREEKENQEEEECGDAIPFPSPCRAKPSKEDQTCVPPSNETPRLSMTIKPYAPPIFLPEQLAHTYAGFFRKHSYWKKVVVQADILQLLGIGVNHPIFGSKWEKWKRRRFKVTCQRLKPSFPPSRA